MAEKENTSARDRYRHLSPEDPVFGDVYLNQVLKRFNIDLSDPVNQLALHWDEIAGEELSGHVRFGSYRNGVLHLICDRQARASSVRLNSRELIKKIEAVFPEIKLKKIVTTIDRK